MIVSTPLVVLAVAALGWRAASRTSADASQLGTQAVPLTAYIGIEGAPSLSPDGSQVAFHWNGPAQDNVDVYVKTIGASEPVRLTSDAALELAPAWSPDGSRLAFLKVQAGQTMADVMVMPALGGTARRIASLVPSAPTPTYEGSGVGFLAWSPDNRWVAVGGTVGSDAGIWLFAADGSARRRLTSDGVRHERGPVFAGDGRRIAFIRAHEVSQSAVFVVQCDADMRPQGPPARIVDPGPLNVLALAWEPGDRALTYSVAGHMASAQLRRIRFDAAGAVVPGSDQTLAVGDQATGLDIAPSGRLVYARRFRDTGLWRLDLRRPGDGFDQANLPASTLDEQTPDYSPDGSRLAFASTRSGSEEIWIADADGGQPRQMTSMGGPLCANPSWSPDGRSIVFDSIRNGVRDLYLLDVETAEIRPITSGPDAEQAPRWSRDGKWIYYATVPESRPSRDIEIRRMSLDGSVPVRLTSGETAKPSDDGRWLFVSRNANGRNSLWRLRMPDGAPELLVDEIVHDLSFAVGRRSVFFVAPGEGPAASFVGEVDIASGRQRTVAILGKRRWWGLAVSPDERYLVVPAINAEGSDLMVVEPAR